LRGHRGVVWDVRFSPDGSLLASRGQDRAVRLWDVRTGGARGVFQAAGDEPNPIAFLPDGRTLIGANNDGTVHFWDTRSTEAWTLRGHRSYVYPVLLSPDGATIYSGGWDGFVGQPGCLRIWDAASGEEIAASGDADTYVLAAALSPDGSHLALSLIVAAKSPRIDIVDTATGAAFVSIPEVTVENPGMIRTCSLAYSPDGRRLARINGQGELVISNTRTGATVLSRPLLEGTEMWPRVAWSPDGTTVATCHGFAGTLHLWDGNTLEPGRKWPLGHSGKGSSLAFSPDSRRIVTAAENGVGRIWDAATGTLVHQLSGPGNRLLCAVYSPDGQRIATGGDDNYISLWDAHTFEPVARLSGHQAYVYSLAWSADCQRLVSGSGDHTVRIWEAQTLKDRMQARRERQDFVTQVEPLVRRLFNKLGDAARVAEVVKADTSLGPRARQVALQVVLAAAIEARSSTPASSSYAPVGTH
jgi:WD40 repeat protein